MTRAEQELQIRTAIAAQTNSVFGAGKIYARRRFVTDERAFTRLFTEVHPLTKQSEIVCGFVDLIGWTDSGRGCEDNPVLIFNHQIHLVRGFVDERPDGSNSTDDFARVCLFLLEEFLFAPDLALGNPKVRILGALKPRGEIQLGNDPVTGAYSHFAAFLLQTEAQL